MSGLGLQASGENHVRKSIFDDPHSGREGNRVLNRFRWIYSSTALLAGRYFDASLGNSVVVHNLRRDYRCIRSLYLSPVAQAFDAFAASEVNALSQNAFAGFISFGHIIKIVRSFVFSGDGRCEPSSQAGQK